MKKQIAGGDLSYGGITTEDDLKRNLAENCVPEEFMDMDIWGFPEFLEKRRYLMAQFVKKYYEALD